MKKVLFTSHVANFVKFNQPYMDLLKKEGYEVHYASMGEEPIDCDAHFTVPFERSPFKLNNLRAIWQLKKIIDRENYTLIHTHTPMGSVITRIAAMRARKRAGTRVIYTAHGFHFFKGAPLLNWILFYPIEKWLARHTDTLVTINAEDYDLARKRFATDVHYVPGVGIDPKRLGITMTAREKTALRKSLGLAKDDFVMIYPAELSKRKGQLWLIAALADTLKAHKNIQLLLPGKDSLHGKALLLAQELGVARQVHFLGYRRDMGKLLRIADMAVSSAYQEGLPVNILEAMYAGLPVVVTACRGNSDLVRDGENGFVVSSRDPARMAVAVSKLYKDRLLRRKCGDAGKRLVQPYLIDAIMPEMTALYHPKKKVVHLLNSRTFSGAENVVCEIIKNTNETIEPVYCSPSGSISQALQARNVRYKAIKRLSYKEVRNVVRTMRPDVIHAHDFRASLIAGLFHRKATVISHIHQNPDWLHSWNFRSLLYMLCIRKVRTIIVVTDAVARSPVFKRVQAQKVLTIRNYVDKEAIIQKAIDAPVAGSYDIAFCGRLEPVKQPLDFIAAMARISQDAPAVRAVMIGDGSLRDACAALIAEYGLEKNIELVGFQANPYGYMKKSKFLFLTSQAEGFGLVVAEALALGTLALAYDVPGVSEIVGGHKEVLVTDPDDMAKKYKRLAASDSLYQKHLEASQAHAAALLQDKALWQEKIRLAYEV
ncbi:glycosyltransferase [Streptomyces caniscabiei]|uniref:glycosyltransferase n=1 Tax=Streptomyces caniscabiei TaxID=2746961 RepID=UPI0029B280DC|nr:glycosyltransferase [Streptomyces caniscabiei]MDX2776124.1 glycosyltransferase [Streptomyces caniscabiei]